MKNVKDYLDLGLVFVDSDKLLSVSNDKDSKEVCMSGLCIAHQRYCDGLRGGNAIFFYPSEWAPSSFSWRNNDGVKPEYKGLIDIIFECGTVSHDESVIDFEWSLGDENYIAKWRPVVMQSELPTVSPKEDKPMKPVYTAEMHAKGELPPIGSMVLVDAEAESGVKYKDHPTILADVSDELPSLKVMSILTSDVGRRIAVLQNKNNECHCFKLSSVRPIKPIIKTIKVNGFDVPAPMSEAPMIGDEYFTPQTGYEVFYCKNSWRGDKFDSRFLSRGLIHSTESAAIAHAKSMLGIDPNA